MSIVGKSFFTETLSRFNINVIGSLDDSIYLIIKHNFTSTPKFQLRNYKIRLIESKIGFSESLSIQNYSITTYMFSSLWCVRELSQNLKLKTRPRRPRNKLFILQISYLFISHEYYFLIYQCFSTSKDTCLYPSLTEG